MWQLVAGNWQLATSSMVESSRLALQLILDVVALRSHDTFICVVMHCNSTSKMKIK